MKNKLLHLNASFKATTTEDEGLKITGYASTNDKDRAGDVIVPEAWQGEGIENFKKNPIILFNHDYSKPIGRATALSINDKGLSIEATISKAAGDVLGLIKDNVLSAFSVGFMIKDADYNSTTDIFVIKEAELYEVSVVSVPCNQDATFSLAKAFDSSEDYETYKKTFNTPAEPTAEDSANAQDSAGKQAEENTPLEEKKMDPKELQEMLEKVAAETAKKITETQTAAAKKAADEKDLAEKEQEAFDIKVTSSAEKLMTDIEARFNEKNESLESIMGELKEELASKSEEIVAMRESKRQFSDRSGNTDWKKSYGEEATDAYILGLATGKGWKTDTAKGLMQKVNTDSGVEVSSEDFEQIVSTNIQRDIELQLVLAPMFRELPMTSATMILPIMPDAGYAEFVGTTTTDATAPKGNLDERGVAYGTEAGIDLNERVVSTKKLMSLSYLGNETEEDAILPIIGLIRDSMVRSHARAIENAILVGNHADGAFGTGGSSFDGLVTLADTANHQSALATAALDAQAVTAADLFDLRKSMGKYGLRPEDVVYIVSLDAYYNLIEDGEFQDANLVGEATASKLKGKIGSVYGSNVIVCDEFAPKAVGKFNALAVNTRNFVMPRLRGITIESEYQTVEQRRALVATQRIGFVDIIAGAASSWALAYGPIS